MTGFWDKLIIRKQKNMPLNADGFRYIRRIFIDSDGEALYVTMNDDGTIGMATYDGDEFRAPFDRVLKVMLSMNKKMKLKTATEPLP